MFRYSTSFYVWRVMASSKTKRVQFSSSFPPPSPSMPSETAGKKDIGKNKVVQNGKYSGNFADAPSVRKVSRNKSDKRSELVAAAFDNLNVKEPISVMDKIQAANTLDELLSVSVVPEFTQYHALQTLSILTSWTTEKKIKMSDFQNDSRFVNLCKILGRKKGEIEGDSNYADLALVLGISSGDQAAKLVSSITTSQKIQVLSTLSLKKRRTVPLLRALAVNISNSSENLNIKQAADVLYALATLNFPDDVLLHKVATDICQCLKENKKPAVVGSILTSIGILKYKNKVLLDALAEWVFANMSVCREIDFVSMLLTLASVNHTPHKMNEVNNVIVSLLNNAGLKSQVWLDVVWSLAVLNKADTKLLKSVLEPSFIANLTSDSDSIPVPTRMKLLNVNAVAQHLVTGYPGPILTDSDNLTILIQRSREKQSFVDIVFDSLSNLFPSSTYLDMNVDSGYGFLIDGVCAIDQKCNPLPIKNACPKSKRIAIYVCDYHDMCRGCNEVIGLVDLHFRLLKKLGYSVMPITYLDFNPSEKLVNRVKYLEKQLKCIASDNT